MTESPLGKGEVESSILSCSTIFPSEINADAAQAATGDCASLRVNDSGTVAGNWQGSFDGYLSDTAKLQYDDRWAGLTYVYRYYSGDGELLYVGISNQPYARHRAHLFHHWTRFADFYRIEAFPSRMLALIAEWIAIEDEEPIHNCLVRPQCRDWPVPGRWYGQMTGWRFIGQRQAWFAIDEDGYIRQSTSPPERPGNASRKWKQL